METEKIELFVETQKGKRIFFYGVVDQANFTFSKEADHEYYQMVLYNNKAVVYRCNFAFNPATLRQQLVQQGVTTNDYVIAQLDIESMQELLDQNTIKIRRS